MAWRDLHVPTPPTRVQTPNANPGSPQIAAIQHPAASMMPRGAVTQTFASPSCEIPPALGHPHTQPAGSRARRMTGTKRPLQSPQLFYSFLFSCLSYFFLFFCLGILPTPAKKKKINNREKLRAVLADCSGRFVCSNPIVPGSCRLLLPAAPSRLLTLGWWGYIASIPVVAGRAKERQKHPSPFPQLMFQSEHWAGAWQGGRGKKKRKQQKKNRLLRAALGNPAGSQMENTCKARPLPSR